MKKRFLAALMLVLGLALGAFAQEKSGTADFIRFQEGTGADSGLQIAVTDYVSSGTTVSLYGVVHIADADYYKKVQKDLDTYDAVLYEGVGGDKQKMAQQKKEPSVLSTIQHLAGDVLDLNFQLDSIDYTRKNLVHADVGSMDELKEKMNGESISPMGQYVKEEQLGFLKPILDAAGPMLKQLLKTQPEWQNKIKSQFAQTLSNTDINSQLTPTLYKAIVLDRNQIVIDVLTKQLRDCPEKKTYAVFYGAAHMPDLEKRLLAMGFTQKSKRWMTAWNVKPVEEDADDDEKAPAPQKDRAPSHGGKRLDDRKKNLDDEDEPK